MCGVPTHTVTAIHTHAAYTPHCTSQRLLRVWGHSTGRLPCCVSYQNPREGYIQPMVLVSDIRNSSIGILQTKLSHREGHEARRVGLEAMPLHQHIEGGHGE